MTTNANLPAMKKMSEIFNGKPCGFSVRMTDEQVSAGQHCINHADALADALESIVSDYNQYRAVNGIDLTDDHCAKLDVEMEAAEAALVAYRGGV